MRAIVCTRYGPPEVLQVQEREQPVPKEDQVLIRVRATSVNYGDLIARNFGAVSRQTFNMPLPLLFFAKLYFGFSKPRVTILGSEFAGEVAAAGKAVTSFREGDQVFGYTGQSMGAYGQYLCMSAQGCLAMKPAAMSYEEAAVVPYGSVMALYLLRKVNIQTGKKILINGASGGIGSAAVQLARHFGAEVTGVCSTPGIDFVKSLGAHNVIDYTKEDFTRHSDTYDIIFDILGKSSFSRCRHSLKPNGNYLLASFKMKQLFQMLSTSLQGGQKVLCAFAPGGREDLLSVKNLIEEGTIAAIIDRRFSMEQAVEAHRYVEEGHARGKVVITM